MSPMSAQAPTTPASPGARKSLVEFRAWGLRVGGAGLRAWGFRVQGSQFSVGFGFRVWDLGLQNLDQTLPPRNLSWSTGHVFHNSGAWAMRVRAQG